MSCSYCYNHGHNRRTCSQLTVSLQKSADGGNAYAASMLANRGKGTGHSKESRQCSFCTKRGHDRRTCLVLKEYSSLSAHEVFEARQDIFERMSEQKISVGALVEFPIRKWQDSTNGYIDQKFIGLVTRIRWDEIDANTYNSRSCLLQVSYMLADGGTRTRHVQPPHEVLIKKDRADHAMAARVKAACSTVIGPADEPAMPAALTYKNCLKYAKTTIKESGRMAYQARVIDTIGGQERYEKLRELQEKQDKAE